MLLSLVIPLFNDEAVLPLLQRPDEVLAGLDCAAEIVRALSFSRNFGHQAASRLCSTSRRETRS
jgi:hypothetical protein